MNGAAIARELRDLAELLRRQARPLAAAAFFVAAFDAGRGIPVAVVLGTLYFLGPYGLLIEGSDGPSEPTGERSRDRRIILATLNLPFLAALVLLGGAGAGAALALTVAHAMAWGTPPIRLRDRPGLDVGSGALLVVLPAACGWLVAGGSLGELPWTALAALAAWLLAIGMLAAIAALAGNQDMARRSVATVLGGRVAAIVCLVAFLAAAVLAATVGPLGAWATLGLGLYLLLPAMVLLIRDPDSTALPVAAARAAADARGLHVLVAGWLALLLAGHWAWFAMGGLEAAIVGSTLATAWVLLDVLLTSLATYRRRLPDADWDAEIPSLTIVVPATGDDDGVAETLGALRDQTYADATTVAVLDHAASGDAVDALVELMGHGGRVIVAPQAPDGWLASSWADHVGAETATTDFVLFVASDTYLVPVAIRKLVEHAQRGAYDLVSAGTAAAVATWADRVVAPGFLLARAGRAPAWIAPLSRRRIRRFTTALEPLLLVRREAYLKIGGHAAAPASRRPGTALARAIDRAGHRVGAVDATDLGITREGRSIGAAIETWRREAAGRDGSLAGTIATTVLGVVAFVLPLILPIVAIVSGAEPRPIVASFAPLGLLAAARLVLTLTQRQPVITILYHPLTVGALLIGRVAAIVDRVTGATGTPAADPASLPSVP